MKQNRKKFILLAASGYFYVRNKDFPSFLVLCLCLCRGLTQEGENHRASSPVGEDPKHPRLENTHFTKLDLTASPSSTWCQFRKPGRGSNNPIMFCSLASSLAAKYFRRPSLFLSRSS